MTKSDISNRTPTVQRVPAFSWPRWRVTPPKPARTISKTVDAGRQRPAKPAAGPVSRNQAEAPPLSPGANGPRPGTEGSASKPATRGIGLLREGVALLGIAGAALTVLAQLAWVMPLSRPFMDVLGWWVTLSADFWIANYESLGFYPHSHLQAAIGLAVFLATMGLGARISGLLSGASFARRWGFLEGMTWPSLAIMGGLAIIFLLGYDQSPGTTMDGDPDSGGTIKYVFAIILMAGYAVGDALGQRGFHNRLYRLAILLLLLIGLNIWLLTTP
jgi:hypothetical protein